MPRTSTHRLNLEGRRASIILIWYRSFAGQFQDVIQIAHLDIPLRTRGMARVPLGFPLKVEGLLKKPVHYETSRTDSEIFLWCLKPATSCKYRRKTLYVLSRRYWGETFNQPL
jgi:hypothetical protein